MVFPAAELNRWRTRAVPPLQATWRRFARAIEDYPLERIGMAAIAAGIVLRVLAMFSMDFRSDGDTYTAMGQAWAMRHEFLMPYGDVTTWAPAEPGYSNHYPPAYPFYLGLWFTLFGFGLAQAKAAALFISLLALAAVYFTSRDLYGKTAAALVGGLMAVEPHLVWVTGTGFSENMVLLFFALTMWAIIRSLTDNRFIVLAGLFAGLAYLSRASVGYFFVVAGIGGFAWRFLYMRWRVFTNLWYMLAIVVFGGIVGAWALRNALLFDPIPQTISLFGFTWSGTIPAWETSSYVRYVQNLAISKPDQWSYAIWMKLPFFIAMLAWYVVPFLPESVRATRRIRQEETSALWLSVFLVWVLAWLITAMFWVFEQSFMYWLDNHRYVVIGLLPLGWLVVREMRTDRASARIRYAILLTSLFVACAATFVSPVKFSDLRAAEHMDDYLQPGDHVAVDGGTIKYAFYAYLTHPEQITIYGCTKATNNQECMSGYDQNWVVENGYEPDFIVTLKDHEKYGPNYTKVYQHNQTYWNGGVMRAALWAHNDVIAARGIETGIYVQE